MMAMPIHRRPGIISRMISACTTWRAMRGSGLRIVITTATTGRRPMGRLGQPIATMATWSAAVPGPAIRGACGPPAATVTPPRSPAAVSALPGRLYQPGQAVIDRCRFFIVGIERHNIGSYPLIFTSLHLETHHGWSHVRLRPWIAPMMGFASLNPSYGLPCGVSSAIK
jgi:hypothetical protein